MQFVIHNYFVSLPKFQNKKVVKAINKMETTFDKFITNNPEQKILFDKEYTDFVRTEMQLFEQQQAKSAKSTQYHREYAFC